MDRDMVLETLQWIRDPGEIVEIRIIDKQVKPWIGYFDNFEALVAAIEPLDADPNTKGIYLTLNPINPALLARACNRMGRGESGTADADVIARHFLYVDLDPVRPSGISATEEEIAFAREKGEKMALFLADIGFTEPLRGESGNGYHLIYRIALNNDDLGKKLVETCLKALHNLYSDSRVHVDTTTANAARISKLYGTITRKGDSTAERPHRMARLLSVGSRDPTPYDTLKKLADYYQPEEKKPSETKRVNRDFELRDWLDKFGVGLPKYAEKQKPGCRFFAVFDICPFDSAHTDKSAFIGQKDTGEIFCYCHHNSCGGVTRNRWREIRDRYEPYSTRQGDARYRITVTRRY